MAYKVFLDAGHGGYDYGAVDGDRKEKDDVLKLTLAVGKVLENNGIDVGYSRRNDLYDSPLQKVQEANAANADLFLSFHRNSGTNRNQYDGVQTLLYNENGLKKEIADEINASLEKIGFRNLGTDSRPELIVLKRTKMPALLLEAGFINNDTDNQIFDEKLDKIAEEIAFSILRILKNKNLISKTNENNKVYDNAMHVYRVEEEQSVPASVGTVLSDAPLMQNVIKNYDDTTMKAVFGTMDAGIQEVIDDVRVSYNENGAMRNRERDSENSKKQNDNVNIPYESTWERRKDGKICFCIDPEENEPIYLIQAGLYRQYLNAVTQKRKLQSLGYSSMIQPYKSYFAVIVGYYDSLEKAQEEERKLQKQGFDTLVRTAK